MNVNSLVAESLTDDVVDGSATRTKWFLDDLYGAIVAPLKCLDEKSYMWDVIAKGFRRGLVFLWTKSLAGDSSELALWKESRKDVQLEVTKAHMNLLNQSLDTVNPDNLSIDARTATPEDLRWLLSFTTL